MRWNYMQIICCTCSLQASRQTLSIIRNPFQRQMEQTKEEIVAHLCWQQSGKELAIIERQGKLIMLSAKKSTYFKEKTPSTWES